MLEKFRRKLSICQSKLRFIPGYYAFTVIIMFVGALMIRMTTNNSHLIYNALDGRGIFPGPFVYMLGYFLRLFVCAVILAYCTFSRRIYEERVKAVLFSLICSVMMLWEYKLIFGGVSLALALLFCLASPFFAVLSFLSVRIKERSVALAVLIYAVLQMIFFVQLISLIICI